MRYVKITRRPAAESTAPKATHALRISSPWRRRDPLTLRVRYWGGPECRLQVKARARTFYFGGHDSIYDVMRVIWGESIQGVDVEPDGFWK